MKTRTTLGRRALALALLASAVLPGSVGAAAAVHGNGGTMPHPPSGGQPASGGKLRYRPVGCLAAGPLEARAHGPRHKVVALSFDDGPSIYTRGFVQMLRANGAVGTFFVIGKQLGGYSATLREELRDGDAIGDHTWSHPDLLSSGEVQSQLGRAKSAILAQSGYAPCVFRPPYGDYDATVLRIARSLGLDTVTWDVDPSDYALPGTQAIEQRVLAQVQPGSIVLSHDGGGPRTQTLAAYPRIISALRARGYSFETVPQLLGLRTVYLSCRRDCQQAALDGPLPRGAIVRSG